MRHLSLLLGAAALAACGPPPPPQGSVELRFDASDTVRTSGNLKDPLKGWVYGAIFLQEDVSIDGPGKGATQYGDVAASDIDCTAGVSTGAWTGTLAPGLYTFLGFFDVDGNGDATRDPDPGDPVTLPFTNKFEVKDKETTKRLVLFELVYN